MSRSKLRNKWMQKRYKGMEHLQQHYAILHTQSFPDTVEALAQVCAHNGGGLK